MFIPVTYRTLFLSQAKLGWFFFIQGRISLQWQCFTRAMDSHNNPKRWSAILVGKLQMVAWDMWTYRNGLIHDPNHVWNIKRASTLNGYITADYQQGITGLDRTDHSLFHQDLSTLLSLPCDKKELWLRSVQVARSRPLAPRRPRRNLPGLPLERRRMFQWLHPSNNSLS